MKRKIALLMAMVFGLMCCFSSFAFAEEADVEEIVIEETTEETSEEITEDPQEEIPAEDEEEETPSEEIPIIEEITEEQSEGEMTLQAIESEVQEVADAITAEMLTKDREPAHAVTKNLDMSLAGDIVIPDGVTVTFESDNTAVIANDGTVVRAIGEDTEVTVTATVSKAGSDDAVKELTFNVLNMETALFYANNYYYPDLVNTEFISYGNSSISDFAYENANSGHVSTYLYPYEDGYGVNVKRLTGQNACYLDSITNVSAPGQTKLTHSATINISNWGAAVKRLDIELFGTTTKAVSMGKVEINEAAGSITVVPTAGSDFARIYVSKRLSLNTDYKLDFVVDYENHKFEFLIDGVNYFEGTDFNILTAFTPSIQKANYYFFRSATDAEFTIKDTVVTGAADLSEPQVALDMIDEGCFTYTDSGKITDNFDFIIPENVTTLAGLYGFDVTLTSSKPSSIQIDGYNATVTKGEEKQDVTLTVTIGNAEKSVSKSFEVKVHNLAATNMIEAEVPVITQNGENKDIAVDVYCENLVEGETSAPVYLFAVRKDKVSGKIDAVDVDSATLTIGGSDTLTASLPDGGDDYDYVVYVWDSFEGQKSVINQPPAEPADLAVTGTTSGSATLEWTKADDDRKAVSSYNIYRNGNYVGSTSFTNYTGENLDFGDTYTFGVTTVDDSGLESEYMAEITATTEEIPTITYVSKDPVEAPNATQVNSDNIVCSWQGQNTYLWTAPTEADGLMCHETTLYDRVNADDTISKIHSFFHTRSPFTYIDGDTNNIVVEITYFDEKPASNTGTESISVSYQGGSASTSFTNTGYWKTKVFEITNAKFTEEALTNASSKYNIRYNSTTPGLKVYKTSIVRADEYVRPVASVKMDGALILRDILVYRQDGLLEYDTVGEEKCLLITDDNYLEMDVETVSASQRTVNVEICYLDEGTGNINLDYAGEDGTQFVTSSRTDSGEWKTEIFTISDAMFNGSLPGITGRNLDLVVSGDGDLRIKSVRVY